MASPASTATVGSRPLPPLGCAALKTGSTPIRWLSTPATSGLCRPENRLPPHPSPSPIHSHPLTSTLKLDSSARRWRDRDARAVDGEQPAGRAVCGRHR
eukprot:3319614-Prymnesium_polylepis.2